MRKSGSASIHNKDIDYNSMIENKKQLVQITIDEGLEQDEDQNNSFSDKDKIVGMCEQFISTNQKGARQLNIYEIPTKDNQNWEPMACHFRNIQYTNENVRTPQTLTNCLEFVCSSYLPYYRKIFTNEAERKRVELFLYDRLRSIKCEFYVQEVFIPKIHLKLFKIILFLETMMGQPVQFSCIQQFIAKQTKLKYYKVEQDQACFSQLIQYAIYLSKKERLLTLLDDYWQDICENQQILKSLENKTKILNKNYVKYLEILMTHPSIYVRLILWSQITRMREIIIGLYKKARLNERAGFICRVLGYAKMDGWINLSEAKDVQRLEKNRKKFDLQIKLWIGEEQLLAGLKDLQISDY